MTDKKEEEFRVQFKDSIQIMAGALKAGYSAENAIKEKLFDFMLYIILWNDPGKG